MSSPVGSLAYDDTPRKRRWSAKWLVIAGLLTAVVVASRWVNVVKRRIDLFASKYEILQCEIAPDRSLDQSKTSSRSIQQWSRFFYDFEGAYPLETDILFLGWRIAPNGQKRFVEIGAWSYGNPDPRREIIGRSIDVGGTLSIPKEAVSPSRTTYGELFTAVIDKSDASHVSVRDVRHYDHTEEIIDCYLMNDGTLRLELRPLRSTSNSSTARPPVAVSPRVGS